MEFFHPLQDRRDHAVDAAVMETALAGAMDIRDSIIDQEPGPYSLPLGTVPHGIEASAYAERVGDTAQELLGALGCHDVELDRYVTGYTSRIKPRRTFLPVQRPGANHGPRVMFRHKVETPA